MENLNNIPNKGTFGNVIKQINSNFSIIKDAVSNIEYATRKNKGMFNDASALSDAIPSPLVGDWALVGNSFPCAIYVCETAGTWVDSEETYDGDNVELNDYVQTATYETFAGNTNNKINDIEEKNKIQPDIDASENDFDIRDDKGNIIVAFNNGHLKTKNFNSKDVGDFTVGESESDFDIRDENNNILFQLSGGHIKTKNFDSRGITTTYNIYCIGDSTTEGQAGINNPRDNNTATADENCYPNILGEMIGTRHKVINLGCGGQKTGEILVRCALLDAIVKTAFTLKGDKTTSVLCSAAQTTDGTSGVIVDSVAGEPANYQMVQGTTEAKSQMSCCYINGIKCIISYSSATGNLNINRFESATGDISVNVGTHITFGGYKQVENGIFLFKVGENDVISNYGNSSFNVDNYIAKIKTAIQNLGTDKWLVMGEINGSSENMARKNAINEKLSIAFGSHFVDLAGYFTSDQAFSVLGITPTTSSNITSARQQAGVVDDESCMEQGITPSSFWRYSYTTNHLSVDKIHLNHDGYYLVAKLFYDKMKQFNWI